MRKPKNVQIIKHNGMPAFAVIPYHEYLRLVPSEDAIPHEVVDLAIKKDYNRVKAWRVHLGLTQKEVAERAGMSQSALSQIERARNTRSATLEKLAAAMELHFTQLAD